MDSRALFYKQLYETLKGKFPKPGIKAPAFHNRRLTQMEPRMDADNPFETLKGEFQINRLMPKAQSLKTKKGGERPACQQTKGMSALGRMAGRLNKQNERDKLKRRR